MSVPARFSLVTLGVRDVAASTAFYERLGWVRSGASVDGVVSFFPMGASALGLFGATDLADDAGVPALVGEPSAGPGSRGVSVSINLASPAEVDRVFAEWVAAGATPVKKPVTVFWGGYSSYVADPDGHLWELAHNPGFPLDADGGLHLPD